MRFPAWHLRQPQAPFNALRSFFAACNRRIERRDVNPRLFGLPIYASWDAELAIEPEARLVFENNGFLKLGVDYSPFHAQMPRARIHLKGRSRLSIRGSVDLHQGCLVWGQRDANIVITESFLSNGSRIIAENHVEIGAGCAIAWDVTVLDTDFHHAVIPGKEPLQSRPIVIGDRVWIGAHSTILKGSNIGEGSIVAAGSVVRGTFPPGSLISGAPAKLIRDDVSWY